MLYTVSHKTTILYRNQPVSICFLGVIKERLEVVEQNTRSRLALFI